MPETEVKEQIKQDLRDVRIFCGRYFPFVVIPLSYVPIVATRTVPTAGVDERGVLAINPEWWTGLSPEAKRFAAIHECLHLALLHPFRARGFDHAVHNVAADGKVNNAIADACVQGIKYDEAVVTLSTLATVTGLRVEDLEKMSTEEIARTLERKVQAQTQVLVLAQVQGGNLEGDLLSGRVEGELIQDGLQASFSEGKGDGERLREAWKRLCEKARAFARQAGTVPAGLERLVEEVLEVKPPWYVTLRFGLGNGKVDASYARTSRRGDDYPGQYGYNYNVWCLVDTSGSIGEEELRYFLGIVKHESRSARVFVVPWDAQAYEVLKAERPADVARRVARKMKGGGGTVCLPALKKVHELMNNGDAVIVLTDGEIFDIEKEETQKWLKLVSTKAGFAMVGYTTKPVTAPGFLTANIRRDYHEG